MLNPGTIICQRYRIVEQIGIGGFGATYKAIDLQIPGEPQRVVKHLSPRNSEPEAIANAQRLFKREAESLCNLEEHDRIPRIYGYCNEDGEFYLIQEFIEGHNLSQEIQPGRKWSESKTIEFIKEILEILKFVHEKGIVHRDIKPSNIMRRDRDNRLILIDFGIVKEILTVNINNETNSSIVGTPRYMASEQAIGRARFSSDIYSLGMLGIEAVTGMDFTENRNGKIIWQPNCNVSQRFATVLTKMVEQNWQARYHNVTEVINDIDKKSFLLNSWIKFVLLFLFGLIFLGVLYIPLKPKMTELPLNERKIPIIPINGRKIDDTLDDNDMCDPIPLETDIYYCQKYIFTGQKDRSVTIKMNSDNFDPYLVLLQPNGEVLQSNGDISPNNWNSKILVPKLPTDGQYTIIARTNESKESGDYTITARMK